jgi:type II secretory pathway pseudopilin PulG
MSQDFSQPPIQNQATARERKPFSGLPGCLIVLLLIVILYLLFMPVFTSYPRRSKSTEAINNMKQVGIGFMLYISENDNHFPNAMTWHDAIHPYVKNKSIFGTPLMSVDGLKTTVAMNSGLSKASESEITEASKTVLIFLSTQTRPSPRGGKESMAIFKESSTLLGFADISVKKIKVDEAKDLIWNPVTKK